MTTPTTPMNQDGGDGEHASIAVSQGIRDLIQSGNYSNWGLAGFTELETSDENQTVFGFTAGDTDFHLVLTKATE